MPKTQGPQKREYYIASFSGGKDSTAMVLRLIELGYRLDEVLCCDTTMEFPAMYRHIEKVKAMVEAAGVKFTILRAKNDFEYYMLRYIPERKNEQYRHLSGFSWPGPRVRWCTSTLKTKIIGAYLRDLRKQYDVIQYIGLAADEGYRLERENNQDKNHLHPLVEWGWSETDALAYCESKGYDWEGLYKLFGRVSCWCCPLQPLSELRTLRQHFPELWQRLRELDEQTWRTFKVNASVADLEKRFDLEEALEAANENTSNRAFYRDLKRYISGIATIESIVKERKEERDQAATSKQLAGQLSLWYEMTE